MDMTPFLENFDADDINLLSHQDMDFGRITLIVDREAGRIGLKINTNRTKVLSLMGQCTLPISINEQSIESVYQFVYLSGFNRTGCYSTY